MARAERDINASIPVVADFAQELRTLRLRAGNPSYRVLAARTHFAPSTLSTAASGDSLPSLQVTLAYVRACRGNEEIWRQRWTETSRLITRQAAPVRSETTAESCEHDLSAKSFGATSKIGNIGLIAFPALIVGAAVWLWSILRNSNISAPLSRGRISSDVAAGNGSTGAGLGHDLCDSDRQLALEDGARCHSSSR